MTPEPDKSPDKSIVSVDGKQVDISRIKNLFEFSDSALHNRGVSSEDANRWTLEIARGQVPEGYESLEQFVQEIGPKFDTNKRGRKKKS
ncbi:hypothetical protein A2115_03205 [Candidatus Woesebacteria bacterium GWA1_41_8]|uniref:Uncharacterized protein n=1 Tax=Candidatus Woesebacteria bacterium GWA1_41_8 TaxID=1802471 RepID=A0A1F7WHR4_9BACT|nr:MAG: hypothetical protein A2115_03205 [Candidatus Woesebacteria bacterium GWA1_41_8]